MEFSLEVWKERAADRLHQAGSWLERRRMQDTPYLLYGALCGMTLWPLVEAAQKGELLPVMMALGSVAGGIGGNLVAEQVQRWKDRAAASGGETEVTEWVVEHAPSNTDLRDALDTVLEKLDAVTQAQAALGESDRRWFGEVLREELAGLGNLERFEGAIARGAGAKATGKRGVIVEGDVQGDVVTGKKTTVFDQRGQTVDRQFNVAGDWAGKNPPGVDDDGD